MTAEPAETIVFLLDVDNTLLDNDRLKADLAAELEQELGATLAVTFWDLYEKVRLERDVVDIPLTVRRFREQVSDRAAGQKLADCIEGIDFRRYVFPDALESIKYVGALGTAVILSDGDEVFQRRKITESGLAAAVDGRILLFIHKEQELPQVFAAYPADHYVVVDDKPRIIAALERECPSRFTTVLVLQGKYAQAEDFTARPDIVIPHIADLQRLILPQFEEIKEREGSSALEVQKEERQHS